jgi:hypothetical protein
MMRQDVACERSDGMPSVLWGSVRQPYLAWRDKSDSSFLFYTNHHRDILLDGHEGRMALLYVLYPLL